MKQIKKEHSLKLSRTEGRLKGKYLKIQATFKTSDKVNCFKASGEKGWLLYEFPFSLNPGDKPNVTQTKQSYSPLYPASTEDQFQANSKKN